MKFLGIAPLSDRKYHLSMYLIELFYLMYFIFRECVWSIRYVVSHGVFCDALTLSRGSIFFVRNLFQSSPVWTQEYPILSCLRYFLISQQKTYRSIYTRYIGGAIRTISDKTAPLVNHSKPVHFYLFLST